MTDSQFPKSYWKPWDSDVTFAPGDTLPEDSNGKLYAVLVFVFYGDKIALADIEGRGVCVPSGRIEPGETIDQTAVRECYEETGAELIDTRRRLLGTYRMVSRAEIDGANVRFCPVFIAEAAGFVPIPDGSESRGMFLAAMEDVAEQYFFWDDLLSGVFEYAQEVRGEAWHSGVSLTDFMSGV